MWSAGRQIQLPHVHSINLLIFIFPAYPTAASMVHLRVLFMDASFARGAWLGAGSPLAVLQLFMLLKFVCGLFWMSGVLCRFKESLQRNRRSQDSLLDRFVSLDKSIQVLINLVLPLRPIVHHLQWKDAWAVFCICIILNRLCSDCELQACL